MLKLELQTNIKLVRLIQGYLCVKKEWRLTLFSHESVKVLAAQSCPTLWDPMDCSPPGSMGLSRQEYWSGLPFPFPGGFPDPEVKPWGPALQADSLPSEPGGKPSSLMDPP